MYRIYKQIKPIEDMNTYNVENIQHIVIYTYKCTYKCIDMYV